MTIDHDRLEALAIELCESRMGKGHWHKPGTRRTHWRKRALPLATLASEPLGIGRVLMRACGWSV